MGILGIPLPILPTTLFLLLAIACFIAVPNVLRNGYIIPNFTKLMSPIFEKQNRLPKNERKIIIQIYVLMGISIVFAPII
ncbi:MAG: DUF454 family protein [Streptococcus salivarius]